MSPGSSVMKSNNKWMKKCADYRAEGIKTQETDPPKWSWIRVGERTWIQSMKQ